MTSTSQITSVTDVSSQSTSDDKLRDLAVLGGPVWSSWSSFVVLQVSFAVFLEVLRGHVWFCAVLCGI